MNKNQEERLKSRIAKLEAENKHLKAASKEISQAVDALLTKIVILNGRGEGGNYTMEIPKVTVDAINKRWSIKSVKTEEGIKLIVQERTE